MLSSFTRDEKVVLGFVIAIMIGGTAWTTFGTKTPQPLFMDSYHGDGQTSSTLRGTTASLAAKMASHGSIDLNTADADVLAAVPGIGPSLASEIVAYRTAHGPFRSYEELDSVKGVGASKLAKIRPFVTVQNTGTSSTVVALTAPSAGIMPASPMAVTSSLIATPATSPQQQYKAPITAVAPQAAPSSRAPASSSRAIASDTVIVNINAASETELASLKRVGPVIAKRIVEYRLQHGAFATVDALADVKGIGPKILEENRPRLAVR